MRNKLNIFNIIDKETGKIYDAEIKVYHEQKEAFMRIFQLANEPVLNSKLQGTTLRVLFALLLKAKYQNVIPNQTKLAATMSLNRPQVAKAFKELREAGFLIKQEGVYIINPVMAWKGTDKAREQAIKDMAAQNRSAKP